MMDEKYIKNVVWKKYHVGHIHYVILKRIFLSNPQLYQMIDGVIITENCFDIEFLTFDEEYYKIWECLQETYPRNNIVRLNEMGYDENLHCYDVDIKSPGLLDFIKHVNRLWNEQPYMKKRWIEEYG